MVELSFLKNLKILSLDLEIFIFLIAAREEPPNEN